MKICITKDVAGSYLQIWKNNEYDLDRSRLEIFFTRNWKWAFQSGLVHTDRGNSFSINLLFVQIVVWRY